MVVDIKSFLTLSIPSMLMFGIRHAHDVEHITAIDNLARLHDAKKGSRWVVTGFSLGYMYPYLLKCY
jgi:high-affinity nickel-transport protein